MQHIILAVRYPELAKLPRFFSYFATISFAVHHGSLIIFPWLLLALVTPLYLRLSKNALCLETHPSEAKL